MVRNSLNLQFKTTGNEIDSDIDEITRYLQKNVSSYQFSKNFFEKIFKKLTDQTSCGLISRISISMLCILIDYSISYISLHSSYSQESTSKQKYANSLIIVLRLLMQISKWNLTFQNLQDIKIQNHRKRFSTAIGMVMSKNLASDFCFYVLQSKHSVLFFFCEKRR